MRTAFAYFTLALSLAGCGDGLLADERDCSEDRCQGFDSREELLHAIADHADPIASFLRDAVDERGNVAGDYRDVLEGVGTVLGCDEASSFVVLSNHDYDPKSIFTRCSSTPVEASRFFLLLPFVNASHSDLVGDQIHMVAWDPEIDAYRRYATFPSEEGGMEVNVEPDYCLGCHGAGRQEPVWQPLMNEMTNPWSQWNAEPGFASHLFDEYIPSAVVGGANFSDVNAEELLDSASNLEPIVRAGIDRISVARVAERLQASDRETALSLLHPLFCDEHVNFVSEIHGTGEILSSALLDNSLRDLLRADGYEGNEAFMEDATVRIPAAASVDDRVTLMAVRGESDRQLEMALATRRALSPLALLQVRSLDWRTPVASAFRCGLYEDGAKRIRDGALRELEEASGDLSVAEILPAYLDELMHWHREGGQVLSLAPAEGVVSIPDASERRPDDSIDDYVRTPAELARELQAALDGATRQGLRDRRDVLACWAAERFPTAPQVPNLTCP